MSSQPSSQPSGGSSVSESTQMDVNSNMGSPVHGKSQEKTAAAPSAANLPNGGLTAWLQVVGAFFLFFNSWYVYASRVSLEL